MKKAKKPFQSEHFDPNGSYTGNYKGDKEYEAPVQDADDL